MIETRDSFEQLIGAIQTGPMRRAALYTHDDAFIVRAMFRWLTGSDFNASDSAHVAMFLGLMTQMDARHQREIEADRKAMGGDSE